MKTLTIPTLGSTQLSMFVKFEVTGKHYNSNKRFGLTYHNYAQAMMINLWKGSVWGVLPDGTRKLLKRVYN